MAASVVPGVVGLLVALVFGRELLGLIYGPRFAESAEVFVWVMVVGVVAFVQTPRGYGVTAMQPFMVQPAIFGLAAAVNGVCCLLLVPGFGILGATFAWLGGLLCQFILAVAVHWRCLRRPAGATAPTPAGLC
jgi:O-antigen/teichoic acid export membrane protein